MQKTFKITSVKILKQREGNGATIDLIESDGKGDEATGPRDHTAPVHPDFEAAIAKLAPHYALLTGQIPAVDIPSNAWKDHHLDGKIYVSGYSISKKAKTEGVVITGHFYNFRERAVITNTPWEAFGGENGYPLMSEVGTIIGEIDREARAYLDGSKRGTVQAPPAKQMSIDDTDEKGQASGNTYPNGDMSNASPEAQARIKNDSALSGNKRSHKKQTAANPSGE